MKGGAIFWVHKLIFVALIFGVVSSVHAASIGVPFKSQVLPGSWNNTLNCGQTSFLMVKSFFENTEPSIDEIKEVDDWLYETYGDAINGYSGSYTNVTKLTALAKEYGGYSNSYYGTGDINWLKETLQSGQPVIVAVHIDMDIGKGGHFMVALGIEGDNVVVHDPGKAKGADRKFSIKQFTKSWAMQNNSYVVVKSNVKKENQPPTTPLIPQPTSPPTFLEKLKLFFSDFFSSDPEVAETEGQTIVEAEGEEESEPEEEEASVYNVSFLPKNISLNIAEGQTEGSLIIFAKNTGDTTWQKNDTSLNVVGGPGKNTQYYHPSWKTSLRPTTMVEENVSPGEIASFAFTLTIPGDITNTFQLQLVHQKGSKFAQVGSSFVNISFVQEEQTEEISEQPIDSIEFEANEQTFFEGLKDIQDVLGEKIGDVFESITKIVPKLFVFGGGSSSDATEEIVEDREETVVEVVLPEVAITSPTSTVVTTSMVTTTISGTLNESVSYLTVNDATSTFEITSSTWSHEVTLLEDVTTTFSFVGWNASSTVSSTEVSISYFYTPEVILPEIAITSPTTSPYISTSMPVVIFGTFNTSTSYLTVNNATSTLFTMNTSTNEWSIPIIDLEEYVTTTYIFVGWNEEGVSSTPVGLDMIYTPMVVEVLAAPTILFPSADTTYTTSSIEFVIAGTAPTGTVSAVLDLLGTTTSIAVVDNAWSVDVHYPGTGSYDFVLYGIDVDGVTSATSTITLTIERELDYDGGGLIAFSEIAWMGTEASANDEWFEIMFVPPDQQGGSVPDFHVMWGEYDYEGGTYDHDVAITEEVLTNWNISGPPILVFDGPGLYIPLHPQFVFERTSQDTLPTANGLVYTGGLSNTGERMLILTDDNIILDDVDMSSGWHAGDNDTKEVMLRTDLYAQAWCTYSSCPPTEYIGSQLITDADGSLIKGSPYSPYQLLIPQL